MMFSFGMAWARPRRVSCRSILQVQKIQKKNLSSTKGPRFNSSKYSSTVAGLTSALGLWWLITTRDDIPSFEISSNEHLGIAPGPCKDQVTRILSRGAYSYLVKNVAGVNRYDGTQVASNSPCEDKFAHSKLASPWNDGTHWMAWGVFDGHSGWETAELLRKQLLPFVRHSLHQAKSPSNKESVPEDSVQRAIKQGFLNFDRSIFSAALDSIESEEPLQEKVQKLLPVYAGSCALLSLYDPITSTLRVACTGDSRAVLGQELSDSKWGALPLSVDQTGSNKEEISRLYNEHPGEEAIVRDGRVLGLMVSRAFGDSRWKWPLELQQNVKQRFNGPTPLTPKYDIRSPPYLTAEPTVTSTKIDPHKPSFLIMATDGLWDMLSNQQAVNLVGKWLESQLTQNKQMDQGNQEPRGSGPFDFGHFWKGISWKFVDERTTIEDENAAVHLVRNSLGGNNHELVAGRLAFNFPRSRHVRDDITVQVVFFNTPALAETS